MKTITKKILPEWYDAIISGKKKYELRLADFDIQEGDTLRLEEWVEEGEDKKPTGRVIEKKITYVRKFDMDAWMKRQPEIKEKGIYVLQFDDEKTSLDIYDPQSESYGLLFFGIIFGIFGGLVAAIVDRRLSHLGWIYELIVVVVFAVMVWRVAKMLDKKLRERKGK